MNARTIALSIVIIVYTQLLTGCAMYDSKFSCPDSRGARCAMFSRVDNMVDTGEIATAHCPACKHKNCQYENCRHIKLPVQKLKKPHNIELLTPSDGPHA